MVSMKLKPLETFEFIDKTENRARLFFKFFEVEISARKITQQTGLSYPTMLKAVNILRMAILINSCEPEEL